MTTDEDKSRLTKLLQDLEVPEVRLPERCQGIVRDWQEKFADETTDIVETALEYDNPYIPDKDLLEDTERKLRELLKEDKLTKMKLNDDANISTDPNKPWRTNSNKEKLLRINCDIERHLKKSTDLIVPLADVDMQQLVKNCEEESRNSTQVGAERLCETVDEARRNLPNFQYRIVDNSTATAILPEAHESKDVPNNENNNA
ncbi:uncharacterized protein [Battus philenor]|uniref:uncharacterized protein n=1 Tax=Battus philenor TaxID=42288 RepID=UPI0035CEDBA1